MRWLVVLACVGCDSVFGLGHFDGPSDASINYDRCAPSLDALNDPLRYQFISSDTAASPSWDDARATCRRFGMDLAVFNDDVEMGAAAATWPFWFGTYQNDARAWTNIDGCPVVGMPAPQVALGAPLCAAMFDPLDPSGTSCDGVLPPEMLLPLHVLGMWCETPRPETAACLPKDPTTETYTVGPALSYADARAFCTAMGQHLVEISSFAELGVLSRLVHEQSLGDFWMSPTFDGTTWNTVTGCPAEFVWAQTVPSLSGDGPGCLGGVTALAEDGTHSLYGGDAAQCTVTKLALCESD